MDDLKARALAQKVNINEAYLEESARHMLDLAHESGCWLQQIKESLPHGSFMSFCDQNVKVKKSQINNYMSVSRAGKEKVNKYIEQGFSGGISGFLSWVSGDERGLDGKFLAGNIGGPGRGHKAPPKDPEAEPKQYIYAIINPLIAGWVKVGMSDNPRRRLKDMQTYSPTDYELVFKAELPEGFRDNTIHPFLSANFNTSREWFECSADDAIEIIESLLEHIAGGRRAA